MTIGFALDCAVAVLVAAVALWTISARASFAAVVGFVSFGLLVTLVWVRLEAIDAALTEAAIGSGLTGALLLGAAARLRTDEFATQAQRPGWALRICGGFAFYDGGRGTRRRGVAPARPRAEPGTGGRRERTGNRSR